MGLTSFETLEKAQAHSVLGLVTKNDIANHDATFDVETVLDNAMALVLPPDLQKIVRVFRKIINGLLDQTDVGDATTQTALTVLVNTPNSICAYTQEMRDHLEDLSRNYPYVNSTPEDFAVANDSGETLAMTSNNSQHTATLSITTMPNKRINVSIQQRYGASSADLTPWHEVANFIGVHYTQQTYLASNISKSPAAYRELRAVSKQTIGMSVS